MAEEKMAGVEAVHKLLESAAPDVLREVLTEAVTAPSPEKIRPRDIPGRGDRPGSIGGAERSACAAASRLAL